MAARRADSDDEDILEEETRPISSLRAAMRPTRSQRLSAEETQAAFLRSVEVLDQSVTERDARRRVQADLPHQDFHEYDQALRLIDEDNMDVTTNLSMLNMTGTVRSVDLKKRTMKVE
jgi:hypothetical protein